MNDIQKARDLLAKWREGAVAGPWFASREHPEFDGATIANDAFLNPSADNEHDPVLDISGIGMSTARLIVGTAGNPDLWDAIDAALDMANYLDGSAFGIAERIAAAIIAADERMQQ